MTPAIWWSLALAIQTGALLRGRKVHGSRTHPRPGSWPSNRFEDGLTTAWPIPATSAAAELLPDLDVSTSTASGMFRGATGLTGLAVGAGAAAAALQRTQEPAGGRQSVGHSRARVRACEALTDAPLRLRAL